MENNDNGIKDKLSTDDIKILKQSIWLTKRIIYLVGFLFLILLFLSPSVMTDVNSYVIVIQGDRILVTKEQYEMLAVNDLVEISMAPLSRTLFTINKL